MGLLKDCSSDLKVWAGIIGLILGVVPFRPAEARSGYYRTPDLHGDLILFSAEGDLWTTHLDGSDVRRITSHPGSETSGRFSPDGKWIAFAGDYDGNRDVFVVPTEGGEPRRLTWHPSPDEPIGWTADGKEIIFRSIRQSGQRNWELYRISFQGGDPVRLPLGYAVEFSIDPDTGRWAFTRRGGGGTWKRYRGGTADDIWVGDPAKSDYTKVTSFDGMDASPMWYRGRIYFRSDQGGTVNLWSMKPDGSERTRLTDFGPWDARFPSMDPAGRIIFALAGDLHVYDIAQGKERLIPIELPSERLLTRSRYPNAAQYLSDFSLAPEGDRLVVGTRGEIFSVPVKKGVTLPITRGSAARENRVSYGPKGERVVYVTDESGEEVVTTADAWGRGEVRTVAPTGKSTWHFPPDWSPDGQWIAYSDLTQTLYVVKAGGGDPIPVDSSEQAEITEYVWSPDGRWLAYTKRNNLERGSIFIYDAKEKTRHQITSWTTEDYNPAWDPKGRYLYFLSDRSINPVIDLLDFETIVVAPTRPYLVLLRKDVENPLAELKGAPPGVEKKDKDGKDKDAKDKGKKGGGKGNKDDKNDKDHKDDKNSKNSKDGKDDKNDTDEDEIQPIVIDFDGIEDRVVEIPVEPGRYSGLAATEDKLFYLSNPVEGLASDFDLEGESQPKASLMTYDLEEKEEKTFLSGVSSYDLKPKSGKIAVQKGKGELYVLDAGSPPEADISKKKVDLDGLVVEVDPQEEWRQIFMEGWRGMRDFYWDPGMHGLNWAAIRDQYAGLLPKISTRGELQDLLAEMIGELANSHTYVWGGDYGDPVPQRPTGLLGAVLEREGSAFRISRIYRGDPADRIRSPLLEPGVEAKEGDFILAVNHQPVPTGLPFEALLEGLGGKSVLLTVNSTADKKGAREVVVETMSWGEESNLRYADWVRHNREYVTEKTGGKIGYVHIPDMGGRGLREFDKWFYPQLDKEGMVVDDRWNSGGFISQLIVTRLSRHLLWWDRARWGGVSSYPYRTLNGPLVVLINEFAGSDGDIFPAAVQTAGLAPIIGQRTWGGVVGIRGGSRPLVDQGIVTNPEYAWWHPRMGWAVENHGVDPDIEVENLPQEVARGVDAQLDRGISEVLRLHQEKPPEERAFGPSPDRSRKAYAGEK